LVNGITGELLHRFGDEYHEKTLVVISADGRRAAVLRRSDGDETTVDVETVPKGEVIARASFVTNQSLPTFTLSRNCETLHVHDFKSGRLIRYDLPRGK